MGIKSNIKEIMLPLGLATGLVAMLVLSPDREVKKLFQKDINNDGIPEVLVAKQVGKTSYKLSLYNGMAFYFDNMRNCRLKTLSGPDFIFPDMNPIVKAVNEDELNMWKYELEDFDDNGWDDLAVTYQFGKKQIYKNLTTKEIK